ncbi:uncharacterized protein [Fopius arisanus]|uniref:Uncharacterized protein n=1 Tax=Fopius arisanus TaxID=64838 RepID=A0A0C9RQU5_9HYME|nr:PREDICTED: uncharacterized protein LOC105270684 [Fopius arisanus]
MSRHLVKTSSTTSPRIDSYSTGGSEKFSSTTSLLPTNAPQDPEFIRILQEDKIKVMRARTAALFNENVYLKTQIHQEQSRTKELEERLIAMEDRLSLKTESSKNIEEQRDEFLNSDLRSSEKPLEFPSLCDFCANKIQKGDSVNPIVFVTKAELSNLMGDMEELRDGLAVREKAWEGMVEREQSYCAQLTRFAQEVIAINQLAENRGNDLETLAGVIEERDAEVKAAQKEILALKKLVAKCEKRNRAIGEAKVENTTTEINERDHKWIESILKQVSTPRSRIKSKGNHYSAPRSAQNSARE